MVKKGVILCGGMGTRFLPITKSLPKEMLPVVDTPVLEYIVKEMIESGITEICFVISKGKEDIIRHFSKNIALECNLSHAGKTKELQLLNSIGSGAEFTFVYQDEPKGMAHALLCAEDFTEGQPFVLSTGDDLVYSNTPVTSQLISALVSGVDAVIGGQEVADDAVHMYGIANTQIIPFVKNAYMCSGIVEKPKKEDAPSNFAALGRYVLTNAIFEKISKIEPDKKGELQVTDALNLLCLEGRACFYNFEGKRYDMGNKAGAVIANIEYALKLDETKEQIKAYLSSLKLD